MAARKNAGGGKGQDKLWSDAVRAAVHELRKDPKIDLNGTQAAIRAGYSEKTAAEIGYENLRKPQIVEAIAQAIALREERTKITQERWF